jgi:uncharacterized membrane protein YfcA
MIPEILPSYFEWWHIPVIFSAGLIGESYGSVVGGGSIVMISTQTFLGVPLQSAIATDNAAALGTEAGILSETHRKVRKNKRLILWMFIPIALGGVLGTAFLLTAPTDIIKYLMITAVMYLLFHSYVLKSRVQPHHLEKLKWPLLFVFLFLIGLYNNFIGVGEGTFSKIALMMILGLTFIESHGLKTVAMVPIRIYSLVITGLAGLIIWPYLLTLWVGTFFAGKYSTKLMKKVPEQYFKPALTAVSLLFVGYLVFSY